MPVFTSELPGCPYVVSRVMRLRAFGLRWLCRYAFESPALPVKLRDAAPYAAVDMHGRALNRRGKIKI